MNTKPREVVALSGGKDSSAMAVRLKELNPGIRYEYVFTPTGDELPPMVEHFKYLETILKTKLIALAGKTLFDLIEEKKMIPNFWAKWCTKELKIHPFIDYMEKLPFGSKMYVGLRYDEDTRFGLVPMDKQFTAHYPMKDWKWTINDVWEYLDSKGIIIPERTDCGCCHQQRLIEWRQLLFDYPDRYQMYVDIERKYGHSFRSDTRDSWPAFLDDLRNHFLWGRKLRKSNARGLKKCRFCSM